jgi:hypothetical protein
LKWEITDVDWLGDGRLEIGPIDQPLLDVLFAAPLLHRLELRDFSRLQVWEPEEVLDAFESAPGETLVGSSYEEVTGVTFRRRFTRP